MELFPSEKFLKFWFLSPPHWISGKAQGSAFPASSPGDPNTREAWLSFQLCGRLGPSFPITGQRHSLCGFSPPFPAVSGNNQGATNGGFCKLTAWEIPPDSSQEQSLLRASNPLIITRLKVQLLKTICWGKEIEIHAGKEGARQDRLKGHPGGPGGSCVSVSSGITMKSLGFNPP